MSSATVREPAGPRPLPALQRAFVVALWLGLLPSWLGLMGGAHWLLDLLAHFRWQYLVFAVVAAAAGLWLGRRGITTVAVLTVVLNAVLIGHLAWPQASSLESQQFQLRVLGLNVLASNAGKQAVLAHVLASDPDIVFLMEVDEAWLQALAPLDTRYPNRFKLPRGDNFGLALYSRVAVTDTTLLPLEGAPVPSVVAHLHHAGQRFTVVGTHPLPPMGERAARARDHQLAALADFVAASAEPVLVVGDFNATPWSASMRQLTGGKLAFGAAAPWAPTWRALSPFAIPIDHALATPPLVIAEREVGPDLGSDHRPVHYVVGWSGG